MQERGREGVIDIRREGVRITKAEGMQRGGEWERECRIY